MVLGMVASDSALYDRYAFVNEYGRTLVERIRRDYDDDVCKDLSYSMLVRYMHENGLVLKVPRSMPEPPDKNAWQKQREEFALKMEGLVNDPTVELWFGDESGIEGDPRPNRRWVQKGCKPTTPYAGTHRKRNVIGAVCPASGELSCILFSHCVFIYRDTFPSLLASGLSSSVC